MAIAFVLRYHIVVAQQSAQVINPPLAAIAAACAVVMVAWVAIMMRSTRERAPC
jgi:hypothetical protein